MIPRYSQPDDELLPEELDYIASLEDPSMPTPESYDTASPEIVDPWADSPAPVEAPADDFTVEDLAAFDGPFPMDEGNYGRQTAAQLASPEAPVYLPPAPPAPKDAKAAFSATDQQNELFGVEAPVRDVDAEMSSLAQLRATPQQAPTSRANEQAFDQDYAEQDQKAQLAFALNWLAGGPEQAQRFQQAYEQRKAQHRAGRMAARDRDTALNQQNAPITDAQAQMLVRVYRISPEAASRMTQGEYNQIQGVLKSTPYVANQSQAGDQKLSIEQMKLIVDFMKSQGKDASGLTNTQVRGQNALATVNANKKGGGGGAGPATPRDIANTVAIMSGVPFEAAVTAVKLMESGQPAQNAEQERLMVMARGLVNQDGESYAKTRKAALERGGMGRALGDDAVDRSVEAQRRDVSETFKAGNDYRAMAVPFIEADMAIKKLGPEKLAYLSKFGTDITGALAKRQGLTEADRREIGAVREFIAQYVRSMAGLSLTEGEKANIVGTTGVMLGDETSVNSLFESPQVLLGFLDRTRRVLAARKKALDAAYPDWQGAQNAR